MCIYIYVFNIYYIQNIYEKKQHNVHLDFRGDEAQFGLISFVRCHGDWVLCFLSHTMPGTKTRDFCGGTRHSDMIFVRVSRFFRSRAAGCRFVSYTQNNSHGSPENKNHPNWKGKSSEQFLHVFGLHLKFWGVYIFGNKVPTEMVRTKSNLNGLVFPEFKALIFGATWFSPGTNFTNLLELTDPPWKSLAKMATVFYWSWFPSFTIVFK